MVEYHMKTVNKGVFKMKKLLLLVAMLFAVVSLTACGENLDALELLERSHETDPYTTGIANLDADITILAEGMTFDTPLTLRLEVESEERMKMDMSITIPMDGNTNETTFIRDGYIYTEEDGARRTRSEVNASEIAEIADSFSIDLELITESMIEDSSAERTDDGYRLEFTLNNEGLLLILNNVDMGDDEAGGLFDDVDINNLEDSTTVMIIYMDEDYRLTSSETMLELEMSMEEMGVQMDMTMEMTITIEATTVTIDFPDWLDEIESALPISEGLVGTWELFDANFMDFSDDLGLGFFMVFHADGTGRLVAWLLDEYEDEHLTWEVVNDNHVHVITDGLLERFEAVIVDDILTFTDIDGSEELSFIRTADFE